jgi:ribosome-binding factor A
MSRRNDSSFDADFLEGLTGRRSGDSGRESRRGRNSRGQQKTLQLCRQAERALSLALAGECGDDVLRSLYVDSVVPAPDATQLLVRLVIPTAARDVRADEVLVRLDRVHGILRHAVAEAITRKRAPELAFIIVPEGAGAGAGGVV